MIVAVHPRIIVIDTIHFIKTQATKSSRQIQGKVAYDLVGTVYCL